MSVRLATNSEVENAHNSLLQSELLRLITFSDLVQKYSQNKLSPETPWEEIYALVWLIIKRGCTTHTELAKLLLRSNHKITRIVDKLQKKGLVVRKNSNEDRRVTNIRITKSGLATIAQLIKSHAAVEEQIHKVLGDSKLDNLNQVIVLLRETITGEQVEPPAE